MHCQICANLINTVIQKYLCLHSQSLYSWESSDLLGSPHTLFHCLPLFKPFAVHLLWETGARPRPSREEYKKRKIQKILWTYLYVFSTIWNQSVLYENIFKVVTNIFLSICLWYTVNTFIWRVGLCIYFILVFFTFPSSPSCISLYNSRSSSNFQKILCPVSSYLFLFYHFIYLHIFAVHSDYIYCG